TVSGTAIPRLHPNTLYISDITGDTITTHDTTTLTTPPTPTPSPYTTLFRSPSFLLDNNADVGTDLTLTASSGHVKSANATISLRSEERRVGKESRTLGEQHGHSDTYTLSGTDISSGHTGTLHISDFTGGTLNDQDSITVTYAVTLCAGFSPSASRSPSFLLDNNADVGTDLTLTASSGHVKSANATISL